MHKPRHSLDVQVQDTLAMEESQAKGSVQGHQLSPVTALLSMAGLRPHGR